MTKRLPEEPGEPPRVLIAALTRILSPLVRLLLAHGVTFPALSRLLKTIYVAVAGRHFALEGRPQSDSRISLLTGVHRKDVRALRAVTPDPVSVPESISLGSQLVARWLSERPWVDRDGEPRVLPRRAARGPSFDALAASVSRQDVKPRALLDELLRLGVVEIQDDGHVRLRAEGFVPQQGFDEKAFYLGRNVAEHLTAAVSNLEGHERPFLERAVSYGGLSDKDVESLRELAERLGAQALREVNRKALAAQKRNAGKSGANGRMILGVYFHQGRDDDEGHGT